MEGTLEGSFSMAKHLVESEFEVIPSDGAVEVIFIPTRSASDMPDRAAAAITQPPKFDIWHSAWPQKAARRGWLGSGSLSKVEWLNPEQGN
jgi:hypothetical protein